MKWRRGGGDTEQVPDSVLKELQTAFGGDDESPPAGIEVGDPSEEVVVVEPPSAATEHDLPADDLDVLDDPDDSVTIARTTILIGAEDDLPDPVYLDAVVDERSPAADAGRGSGTTIVIGDELDSSGAFDAVSPPNRNMDPRVRARRDAVKRASLRRKLIWAGAILVVVLLIVGTIAVFASSLFAVEDVELQGAAYTEYYDAAALQQVIEGIEGDPILLVDTLDVERQLEQIPWIERAIVTTDFPHTVLIDVRERQPLAAFQGSDTRYRIIDRDGRVLDVLDGRPADYMLIAGQAPDADRGTMAGAPWAAAAQMVAALPKEVRDITIAAGVDAATGDLRLLLQPDIEVRIGSFDDLDAKLARLIREIRDGLLGIVELDVSTPEVSVTRG